MRIVENFEKISISNHCKQRYTQRIRGITDQKEVKRYMTTEDEEIVENVRKMLQYGSVIYEGKNFALHDNNIIKIVLNGTWIVFVAKESNTAITMYKIDLGLGEELNKSYVQAFLDQLKVIDDSYGETEDNVLESTVDIDIEIEKCDEKIEEYKSMMKQFEDRKTGLEETKKSLNVYLNDIDMRRRKLIGKLICKNAK